MAGKSINQWSTKWDVLSGNDFDKASELLFEYCKSYKKTFLFSIHSVWGSGIGLFFSGRWGTHHGQEVQRTLSEFHDASVAGRIFKELRTTRNLLSELKHNLSGQPLKSDGDLNRILMVIKQKTGIDFYSINADEYTEACENRGKHRI